MRGMHASGDGLAAGVTQSWHQLQRTILKLGMRIHCPASSCMYVMHYFHAEAVFAGRQIGRVNTLPTVA
jgi:hypothetical protein